MTSRPSSVRAAPRPHASARGSRPVLRTGTVDFARKRGARAVEGYPMITMPGQEITWGELRVGSRSIFAAAGFAEVSRPSLRRVVMRRDF